MTTAQHPGLQGVYDELAKQERGKYAAEFAGVRGRIEAMPADEKDALASYLAAGGKSRAATVVARLSQGKPWQPMTPEQAKAAEEARKAADAAAWRTKQQEQEQRWAAERAAKEQEQQRQAEATLQQHGIDPASLGDELPKVLQAARDIGQQSNVNHLWDLYVVGRSTPGKAAQTALAKARIAALTGTTDPVQVQRLNKRKNQWERHTIDRGELASWRATPGMIHLTRDYRSEARGELDDFDEFTGGVHIHTLPVGALLPEGKVAEKRLVNGKAEYLVKPHTRGTRKQYEDQERRKEIKDLELDLRADVDQLMPAERVREIRDRITQLKRELGE